MINQKKTNIALVVVIISLFSVILYCKIEVSRYEENTRVVRVLEKSVKFSNIAKILSTYSRFEELVSIEEYMYCVLETEIKILETNKYKDFINSEIRNKDFKVITNEQFEFNLSIIKQYLQNSVDKRDCDFCGKEK